jgi:hypothetical protein
MSRTILRVLLATLGVILIGRFGVTGTFYGPQWLPDLSAISPTLDSEYRFLSLLAAALGVVLLWTARAPEQHMALLSIVLTGTFLGGIARLGSALEVGVPERPALIATAIELIAPPLAYLLLRRTAAEGR